MAPRNPNDSRSAPHCKRCGRDCEPDDFLCYSCGSEELILDQAPVPHIYHQIVRSPRGTQLVR